MTKISDISKAFAKGQQTLPNNKLRPDQREFTAPPHFDSPLDNFLRIAGSASQRTQSHYLREFERFAKAQGGLGAEIERIRHSREMGLLSYSTLRLYKSCLLFGLSACITAHKHPKALEAVIEQNKTPDEKDAALAKDNPFLSFRLSQNPMVAKHLPNLLTIANTYTAPTLENLYQQVFEFKAENAALRGLLDNLASGSRRSASHRSKHIPQTLVEHFQTLGTRAGSTRDLLKRFLKINSVLGLRPHEYAHATLVKYANDQSKQPFLQKQGIELQESTYWLKVKNAKQSLNRSCGEYRYIGLAHLPPRICVGMRHFFKGI